MLYDKLEFDHELCVRIEHSDELMALVLAVVEGNFVRREGQFPMGTVLHPAVRYYRPVQFPTLMRGAKATPAWRDAIPVFGFRRSVESMWFGTTEAFFEFVSKPAVDLPTVLQWANEKPVSGGG